MISDRLTNDNFGSEKVASTKYRDIGLLCSWITEGGNILNAGTKEERGQQLLSIVDQVSCCLPIEIGAGVATIADQLTFWKSNQDLFGKFRARRRMAVALVDSRERILEKMRPNESILANIKSVKGIRGEVVNIRIKRLYRCSGCQPQSTEARFH